MTEINPYGAPQAGFKPTACDSADGVKQYNKIGGWLILVAISLVLSILVAVVAFGVDIAALSKYEILSDTTRASYEPMLIPAIVFEGIYNGIIVVAAIAGLVLMFRLYQHFPRFMIAFYWITAIAAFFEYAAIERLHDRAQSQAAAFAVARAYVFATIWTVYFLRSKRVKGTFRRRVPSY